MSETSLPKISYLFGAGASAQALPTIKKRNEFIEQKPRSKKRKLNYGTQLAHNEQVLLQVWNSLLVLPGTAAH